MCGNITLFYLLSLKKNVQDPLRKNQLCSKFINKNNGNNQLHKSGANITLYNVAMKGFPLSSHIFIWTYPIFFAVIKFPSKTVLYLSVATNEPGIKYEIYGVNWYQWT